MRNEIYVRDYAELTPRTAAVGAVDEDANVTLAIHRSSIERNASKQDCGRRPDGVDDLLVRHWPGRGEPVLYMHGATFLSALSMGYRFHNRSWAKHLVDRGFDVWSLDFAGFGGSSRYGQMDKTRGSHDVDANEPTSTFGSSRCAQIRRECGAERFISCTCLGHQAAGRYAGEHEEAVNSLVMFGPIAQRQTRGLSPRTIGGWRSLGVGAISALSGRRVAG